MRYQPLHTKSARPDAAVAALWLSLENALLGREPLQRVESLPVVSPTPAAPDVPAAVGGLIAGSYLAILAVFLGFFAGSPLALFSITICAVFVAVFFSVPRIFLAVEADPTRRPTLARFMRTGVETLTGPTTGKDALIQMLIVPVFLAFGLTAMGIIGKIFIG